MLQERRESTALSHDYLTTVTRDCLNFPIQWSWIERIPIEIYTRNPDPIKGGWQTAAAPLFNLLPTNGTRRPKFEATEVD